MFSCEYCKIFKNTYFQEHLDTAAWKLTLGSDCSELCFWSHIQNHPEFLILQKYQLLPNQTFKHNLVHVSPLNLTLRFLLKLGFICSSLTVTTQKANTCSPWTPVSLSLSAYFVHNRLLSVAYSRAPLKLFFTFWYT